MRRSRDFHFVMTSWGAAIVIMAIILASHAAALRFNETASVPIGFWRVTPQKGTLRHGDIISLCPTDTSIFRMAHERGYIHKGTCPNGLQPLLKPVAAIPGDIVVVDERGITVNGVRRLLNSNIAVTDRYGRGLTPFPSGTYHVNENEVWLLSDKALSFDSRYFGPIPIVNIEGIASQMRAL